MFIELFVIGICVTKSNNFLKTQVTLYCSVYAAFDDRISWLGRQLQNREGSTGRSNFRHYHFV